MNNNMYNDTNSDSDRQDANTFKKVKIIIGGIFILFFLISIVGIIYNKKITIDQYLTKAVYEYKDITLKSLKELGYESCNLEDRKEKVFIFCSNEIENEGSKEFYITAQKNKKNQLIKNRTDFFWTDSQGIEKRHVEFFQNDGGNGYSTEYNETNQDLEDEYLKDEAEGNTKDEFEKLRNEIVKKIKDSIRTKESEEISKKAT